jgi:hypothetical protein
MSRHLLLTLVVIGVFAVAPPGALAASSLPNGGNTCLSTDLTVTTSLGSGPGAAADTVTATVAALGPSGQRVSRLHLDLQVQERTATAWVPFVTPAHAETYTNIPGSRIRRTWTLREDAGPIGALLASHVQMRVYGKFQGVCRGQSFGPPLLFGLTAPMFVDPSAT